MSVNEYSPFVHPKEHRGNLALFYSKVMTEMRLTKIGQKYGLITAQSHNRLLNIAGRIVGNVSLFVLGFVNIKKSGKLNERVKTIVSNHLTYIDMLYFLSEMAPSFVSKDSIQNVIFIGALANAYQCIYTKHARGDNSSEAGGSDKIRARQADKSSPPLVIYPEGTTTNGTSVIRFRKGAFLSGVPVQPVVLKYPYSCFSVTWETIPFTYHLFRLLTEFTHKLEVVYLPVYFPSAEELANPQLYADNVQKLMAKELKVPATQHTIYEKLEYHKQIISGKLSWWQN